MSLWNNSNHFRTIKRFWFPIISKKRNKSLFCNSNNLFMYAVQLKSKKGSVLITLLISATIILIISLGVIANLSIHKLQNSLRETKTKRNNLNQSLRAFISYPAHCFSALQGHRLSTHLRQTPIQLDSFKQLIEDRFDLQGFKIEFTIQKTSGRLKDVWVMRSPPPPPPLYFKTVYLSGCFKDVFNHRGTSNAFFCKHTNICQCGGTQL